MEDVLRRLCFSIAAACERESAVRIVYLFGSHAREETDSESDIDIAIFTDPSLSKDQRFALRLRLYTLLEEVLHVPFEKIDVIVLQDVSVLLRYNAVRKGVCCFERDRAERNLFELRVEQEYDDELPFLQRESEAILDRILTTRLS